MNSRYIRLVVWLVVSCLYMTAKSEDGADRMILHYKDGTNLEILLNEMPVIKFDAGELCLNSASTDIRCPLEDMAYYSFAGLSTGEKPVTIPEVSFIREGDIIKIYSENGGSNINIFDLQGYRVNVDNDYSGNCFVFDISTLSRGVYVLSIEGHAIKIIKE